MSAAVALPYAPPGPSDDLGGRPPMRTRTRAYPRRGADAVHYRTVYLLTFPIFMLTSLARHIRPGKTPDRTAPRLPRLSVLGEARAAARTCGSLSLMG